MRLWADSPYNSRALIQTLQIPADVVQLAVARQFVADVGQQLGVPETVTNPLVLAVDESLSNVILHGYHGRPGTVKIEIELVDHSLVVRLIDQAAPFDPTHLPNPDTSLPLDQRPVGGMGVYLTRRSVDRIAYEPTAEGGNQLTLIKNVPA